ncbi:TIGR00730 family Rossman fold protein [uncultured Thiohalocapsa sp.]|uniref:LOG family protein n=1 Tax=uncultured Thiohalocapsa sp. TaxID=768990 RepID=UPI0025E2188A|nr:TIGR00730 family Rossman fold protein [uncultured Thiohalocapsa sp.]
MTAPASPEHPGLHAEHGDRHDAHQGHQQSPWPSAAEEPTQEPSLESPQMASASYRLAYADIDFLRRAELRPVRLQLELLKAELVQQEAGIDSTVVIFGSTRIPEPEAARARLRAAEDAAAAAPDDPELARRAAVARRIHAKAKYYDEARRLAAMITRVSQRNGHRDYVVVTGGGPGIMEAANRGAFDAGGKSIGLRIMLPREERPNEYVTPELTLQFHYFAVRKMHFILRAKALVVFPGGYGTLDELFETLALIQTGKVRRVPVVLFGREYWHRIVDFDAMVEEGTISAADRELVRFVECADEAWTAIQDCWSDFAR